MAQVAAKTYQQTDACQYPQATDSNETDRQRPYTHKVSRFIYPVSVHGIHLYITKDAASDNLLSQITKTGGGFVIFFKKKIQRRGSCSYNTLVAATVY